jgi:hypothetical protein
VWGPELKSDLAALNAHFYALPEEIKQQGIFKFAGRLPEESQGIIRKLFESHSPQLLTPAASVDTNRIGQDAHTKIWEEMKQWDTAPSEGLSQGGDLETFIIKRSVSRKRGSWVQVGPETSDAPGPAD